MVVPIGSIILWCKSLPGAVLLPGWVECDGKVLNDPLSLLNGQIIPNFNANVSYHELLFSSGSGVVGL